MNRPGRSPEKPVSLKMLAAHLKLDPATVSVVLNNVPGRSIPEPTRERIRAAARRLNYQPSQLARSLRSRRTMTIGILIPVIDGGYHSEVLSGIGDLLLEEHYFYFIAHHRHRAGLIEQYSSKLFSRGAEGILAVDTPLNHALPLPAVSVAGHQRIPGITNVVLDHRRAAELALGHLHSLGHREIAFMRGQTFSADSEDRWSNVVKVARNLGLVIRPEMTIQLEKDLSSPELGYPVIQQLLAGSRRFTAILSFNDIAAIGAIRALHDAGFRVPQDVSVIGFDDIQAAAFHNPSLTTIRQPLHHMGELAARLLLERIGSSAPGPPEAAVEPELVLRESTARPGGIARPAPRRRS